MFGFLRKRRAEPQERYELKAVLRLDTSELDAALAKAEELEVTLKRARTLAGELARVTRSLRLNVEVDAYTAEEAIEERLND